MADAQLLVVYRNIRKSDVPAIDELQRQLFPVRYSESFYERLFTPGHYTVLATDADERIIGIASARTTPDEIVGTPHGEGKEGYIMTLGVQEAYRRLGVGAQLLRRIMTVLRSISCTVAALHVKSLNVAACRFYERLGFHPDPVCGWYPGHYLIDGIQYDAYRLVCPLSSGWFAWFATKLGLASDPLASSPTNARAHGHTPVAVEGSLLQLHGNGHGSSARRQSRRDVQRA